MDYILKGNEPHWFLWKSPDPHLLSVDFPQASKCLHPLLLPYRWYLNPWYFLVIALAGWMNREQCAVIEYVKEENRVLRELLGVQVVRVAQPIDRGAGSGRSR